MTELPRPTDALSGLHGLTANEFRKLVKHARDTGVQLATKVGIDRFWAAELCGFQYCFSYFNVPGPPPGRYSLQSNGLEWAIRWRATAEQKWTDSKPFIRAELVTVTKRICYDFELEGDVDLYRRDMALLRTLLV